MIRRTGNRIRYSLTAQVSLWVVGFAVVLFVAALLVMSHYARQGIYREAMEKAQQTLRTTELRIDNTLNEVETAGPASILHCRSHRLSKTLFYWKSMLTSFFCMVAVAGLPLIVMRSAGVSLSVPLSQAHPLFTLA